MLHLYALFEEYIHILCIYAVYIRDVPHLLHLHQPAVYPLKAPTAAGQCSCVQKICPIFCFFALQLDRNCDIVTLV